MESSRLFKMLVVAIALQASSNVLSADKAKDTKSIAVCNIFGQNSWESLVKEFNDGKVTHSQMITELEKVKIGFVKVAILGFFGVDVKNVDVDNAFAAKIETLKEENTVLNRTLRTVKKGAKSVVDSVKNTSKTKIAITAVSAVAIAAAIYKREALKTGAKDLYNKAINSSIVASASAKTKELASSASEKGKAAFDYVKNSKVVTAPMGWASSFWNKLPSVSNLFGTKTVIATSVAAATNVALGTNAEPTSDAHIAAIAESTDTEVLYPEFEMSI